jgi:hypothetical protein
MPFYQLRWQRPGGAQFQQAHPVARVEQMDGFLGVKTARRTGDYQQYGFPGLGYVWIRR